MKNPILFIFLGILMLSFISALEFDDVKEQIGTIEKQAITIGGEAVAYNDLWEKYPPVKIDNFFGFGATIAELALTEHTEFCGGNCESQFLIVTYNEGVLIQDVQILNLVVEGETLKTPTVSDIPYKLYYQSSIKEVSINDYETICVDGKTILDKNGTSYTPQTCTEKLIGSHLEYVPQWVEFQIGDVFPAGKHIVKIEGEMPVSFKLNKVDWIIKTNGKTINEWAVWTADLNVGLIAHYTLDIDARDSLGRTNGTSGAGVTYVLDGKINKSANFTGSTTASYINLSDSSLLDPLELSFSVWYNPVAFTATESYLLSKHPTLWEWKLNSAGLISWVGRSGGASTGYTLATGRWQHLVGIFNTTGTYLYVNGTLVNANTSKTGNLGNNAEPLIIGARSPALEWNSLSGSLDELSLYNRSLTPAEITQLYNDGAGITYTNVFESIATTLNYPADGANLTGSSVLTNATTIATGDVNITNMTLYSNSSGSWGAITTTSGLTGLNVNSSWTNSYSDGVYKWAVYSCISSGTCGFSTTNRTFMVDNTTPVITANLTNATIYTYGANQTLNFALTEANPSVCSYSYNGTNRTISCSGGSTQFPTVAGQTAVIVYANDTLGRVATPISLSFTYDAVAPTISSALNTSTITAWGDYVKLNTTITDVNLDKCWYNYNGTNTTIVNCRTGVLNQTNIQTVSGQTTITVYANDTLGNKATPTSLSVSSVSSVSVNLTSPANGSISYIPLVTMNATLQLSSGTYLKNYSLYDNSSGTWEIISTRNYTLWYVSNISSGIPGMTSNDGPRANSRGIVILVGNNTITLNSITKASGSEATRIRVMNNAGSVLATGTFSGNTAPISYTLVNNTLYRFEADASGAIYTGKNGAGGYPRAFSNGTTVINGSFDGVNNTGGYDVESFDVTLFASETTSSLSYGKNYIAGNNIKWNVLGCNNEDRCNWSASNFTFSIDGTAPTIVLNYPNGTIESGIVGTILQINYTATDTNLDKCWYDYGGTNSTPVACTSGVANVANITLTTAQTIILYANDTAGNIGSTLGSWAYEGLLVDYYLPSFVIEGSTSAVNATFNASMVGLQTATLTLESYSYPMVISEINDLLVISREVTFPQVDTPTNLSAYFTLTYSAGETTTSNVSVLVLPTDIYLCNATINNTVLNLNIREETGKTLLSSNNLSASLYWVIDGVNLGNTDLLLGDNSSYALCSSYNLSQFSDTYLAGKIIYYATGYSTEEYNFDEQQISSQTVSNVSLYLLNSSLATTYLMEVKDANALFLENVILRLYRVYQTEANTTLLVEAPLTNSQGTTAVHVISESERYNIGIFDLDGTLLQYFDDYVFTCVNPLTSICRAEVKLSIDPRLDVTLSQLYDILFYDPVVSDDGTVTITYTILSGNASNVTLTVEQVDMFGTSTPCTTSVSSAGGTLTCGYNETIGESKLQVQFYKGDSMLLQKGYKISDTPDFGGNNFILVFILLLSLVGMAFSSPEWIIVNGIATFLIAGSLWLLNGMSLEIGLGGLAWLLIAGGILIFKITDKTQ